jgi:uncharacterized membrane protein (DUF4010 family)
VGPEAAPFPAGVLIATLGGAAIGLERQRSGHADGEQSHFAGLRTFTLLGGLAGLSGWLAALGHVAFAVVLIASAGALIVAAYVAAGRHDVDGTTEVAALVVLAAGLLAGLDRLALASGVFAVTTLLLVEKSRLHALAARVDDLGLRAGIRFGVMALVIAPLLPAGPFTQFEIRPRGIWLLVLLFSGISFAGYVARCLAGPERGYFWAGLLGGLVSSTQVTWSFARLSRGEAASAPALARGVVAANAMLFPRVLLALAVMNPPLAAAMAWPFAAPLALAVAVSVGGQRRAGRRASASEPLANPLQFSAALQMAVLFQLVIVLVGLASARWGEAGLLTSGALLGLTDVDALTVSMARQAPANLGAATTALTVGVLANTLVKTGLTLLLGRGPMRVVAGTTLASMAVLLLATLPGVR